MNALRPVPGLHRRHDMFPTAYAVGYQLSPFGLGKAKRQWFSRHETLKPKMGEGQSRTRGFGAVQGDRRTGGGASALGAEL